MEPLKLVADGLTVRELSIVAVPPSCSLASFELEFEGSNCDAKFLTLVQLMFSWTELECCLLKPLLMLMWLILLPIA